MRLSAAFNIASRELRGGVRGFRVLLACLALGVASVSAIGTVRSNIETGLSEQGAAILGGDAEIELSYRFADENELAWMHSNADVVSEIVEFRSMAVSQSETAGSGLTQLKGVDDHYPIYGEVTLNPPLGIHQALSLHDGVPGAVMHSDLILRLGLEIGDTFTLGSNTFRLTAEIDDEPDGLGVGFALGPRTIVHSDTLEGSGLIGPGTLYSTKYRLAVNPNVDLGALRSQAHETLKGSGLQWTDRRDASPSALAFVRRVGAFLVLVGLAGIAVGGVGVSAAVRAYLDSKTTTIATLKTIGAERSTIFVAYLMQIAVMIALGIGFGIVIGASLPWIFSSMITRILPLPSSYALDLAPLAEAALYGLLAGLAFSLWSLARTGEIKAAALYRIGGTNARRLPPPSVIGVVALIAGALVAAAAILSGATLLALWTSAGLIVSLVALALAATAVRLLNRRLSRSGLLRGWTELRLAAGSIGGPNSDAAPVIISLGLGLTVLAAVGQIASNLNNSIAEDIPKVAPSFFALDVQNRQFDEFLNLVTSSDGVNDVDTAPMLRGIITEINDMPAIEAVGEHWVLRGDRGVSYAAAPPEDTVITEGEWWAENYQGPPLVSFAEEEGLELGLKIGSTLTVNILGRDIKFTIANFREVEFETIGIGFIMIVNPAAITGAPHTHISTIYASDEAEQGLFNDITTRFPNVTLVSVKEGIERITKLLNGLAAAISYGSGVTLITGFVVLLGAAAAGERRRVYESAILKTLGAARRRVLASLAIRSAILGAAAGIMAIAAGGVAGWAVMRFVMRLDYAFDPVSAVAIVLGGAMASLVAGLLFALGPLNASPSRVLRSPD